MSKDNQPLLQRMQHAGFRKVDFIILALFLGYVAFICVQVSDGVDFQKGILLCILSYYMLRIFYEFTFNRGNIPTLGTDYFLLKKIAEILQKDCAEKHKPAYNVIDCGSGKGLATRMIAKAIPSSRVVGLELSNWPYQQSQCLKRLLGIQNVEYLKKDFFAHDFSEADAVFLFLNGRIAELLGEKLYTELKAGALVVTNEFELKGRWPAPEQHTLYTPFKGTLYVYRR